MPSEYAMKAAEEIEAEAQRDILRPRGPEGLDIPAIIDRTFAPLLAENEKLTSMYQDCDLHRGRLMAENGRLKVLMQLAMDHDEGCVDRDGGYTCKGEGMIVVLRLRKFDFEPVLGFETKYAGPECGWLPVYKTLKAAKKDYPNGPFREIAALEEKA